MDLLPFGLNWYRSKVASSSAEEVASNRTPTPTEASLPKILCSYQEIDLSTADGSWEGETAGDISGINLAGNPVTGAGDINGDGYADLLIGAGWNDEGGSGAGQAYIVFGTETLTTGVDLANADASFIGETAGDQLHAKAGVGDTNGDGYPDFVLVARFNDEGGTDAGQVYLFFGKEDGWAMDTDAGQADASFIGEATGDEAGYWVAGVGDTNGDGFSDFAIGAPNNDDGGSNAGKVYVIFGAEDGWAMDTDLSGAEASFIGEAALDRAGLAVAGVGDVDGNGSDDILIGAYRNDAGGADAGQSYLILGATDGWTTDVDLANADASFIGENAGDEAGHALAGVGDVNQDGLDDFVIGAWGNDEEDTGAGQTYLILGAESGWTMDGDLSGADASFLGIVAGDAAGWSVAGGADYNGDGFDDLWIGARGSDAGGADAGEVYVVLGKPSGWAMDTSLCDADYAFIGENAGDAAGSGVACLGDFDGDGALGDFIIGAHLNDAAGTDAGKTYLLCGANEEYSSYLRKIASGNTPMEDFSSARYCVKYYHAVGGEEAVTIVRDASGATSLGGWGSVASVYWEVVRSTTASYSKILLNYTEAEIAGIEEATRLAIYAADETDGEWHEVPSILDLDRRTLTAEVGTYLVPPGAEKVVLTIAKGGITANSPPGFSGPNDPGHVHNLPIYNTVRSFPTDIEFAQDGTLFLCDHQGRVWVYPDVTNSFARQPDPIIDISNFGSGTREVGEDGLLSMALHPDFDLSNASGDNWIYLYYVSKDEEYGPWVNETEYILRLTRYFLEYQDPGNEDYTVVVDTDTDREILLGTYNGGVIDNAAIVADVEERHNGGDIEFGTDGSLLVSTGDGATPRATDIGGEGSVSDLTGISFLPSYENVGAFRSQELRSLSGKILRIDPETGFGYANNPFFTGEEEDNESRLWCIGLRNPWRFTIKPGTGVTSAGAIPPDPGTLYIADNGWNLWEELNISNEGGGENFGWPCYEGPGPQRGGCFDDNYDPQTFRVGGAPAFCSPLEQEANTRCPCYYDNAVEINGDPTFSCDDLGEFSDPDNVPAIFTYRHGANIDPNVIPRELIHFPSYPVPAYRGFDVNFGIFGRSIIGGHHYDGDIYPRIFKGRYFYADLVVHGLNTVKTTQDDSLQSGGSVVGAVDSFTQDTLDIVGMARHPSTGDLYYIQTNLALIGDLVWLEFDALWWLDDLGTSAREEALLALLEPDGDLFIGDTITTGVPTAALSSLVSAEDVRWSLYDGSDYRLVYYKDTSDFYHLHIAGSIQQEVMSFSSTRLLTVKDSSNAVKMVVTEAGDIELAGTSNTGRPYPRGL